MARTAALEPRWLVGLLNAWALRSLAEQSRGVGWYTICPMLRSGIPAKARSYEPTGYSGADHADALEAVNRLELAQRMAVARYFKPWAKDAIEAEFSFSADKWLRLLRAALVQLDGELRRPVADSQECG